MIWLCASLAIVCIFDYAGGKIPNLFPIGLLIGGLIRSFCIEGAIGLGRYLLVTVGVLVLLYPIFRIGGLGAGDVKLLSVSAGYFPISEIFCFLFFSLFFSVVFSLFPLLKERNIRERAVYFCEYCTAVARSGKWQLYLPQKGEKKFAGVCMSGPILCSALMGLGGVY